MVQCVDTEVSDWTYTGCGKTAWVGRYELRLSTEVVCSSEDARAFQYWPRWPGIEHANVESRVRRPTNHWTTEQPDDLQTRWCPTAPINSHLRRSHAAAERHLHAWSRRWFRPSNCHACKRRQATLGTTRIA